MTIAEQILRIKTNIQNAYNVCAEKGATMPAQQNTDNLSNTINTITGGGGGGSSFGLSKYVVIDGVAKNTGSYDISNGFQDIVTIQTNVMNSISNGLKNITGEPNFSKLNLVGINGLSNAFFNCKNLTGTANFSNLTTIQNNGMRNAFYYCYNLTDADFSKLKNIGDYGMTNCFYSDSKITNAPDFSNLVNVNSSGMYQAFYGCSNLSGILNFSNLVRVGNSGMNQAFYNTNATLNVNFSKLESIGDFGFFRLIGTGNIKTTGFLSFLNLTTIGSDGLISFFEECKNMQGEPNFQNLTTIGDYGLYRTFYNCFNLSGNVSFPNLTTASNSALRDTFYGCYNLTGDVDLSRLSSNDMSFYNTFYDCRNITGVNLCNVGSNSEFGNAFYNTGITYLNLANVTTNGGYERMCANCHNLTTVNIHNLVDLNSSGTYDLRRMNGAFEYCENLTSIDLSNLTIAKDNAMALTFRNSGIESINFSSLTTLGHQTFYQCFQNCQNLTSVSFPNLVTVPTFWATFDNCFSNCPNLSSINFCNATVGNFGNLASGCNNLTSIDFSSLVNTNGLVFVNCNSLTSVNFPNLENVYGHQYAYGFGFKNCKNLTSIDLPKLSSVYGSSGTWGGGVNFANTGISSMNFTNLSIIRLPKSFSYSFDNCSNLTTLSFPALTTSSFDANVQFEAMLIRCNNVTVHFPASIQETIGSWPSVMSGFSGTNTTVLFDL